VFGVLCSFENDRTISFIPPDGEFDLMVYRLNTQVRPLIWIQAVVESHSHSRVEYSVKAKSNFKRRSTANNVEIIIPVPADADSPSFKTGIGKVEYVPDKDCIIWRIKQFPGQTEYIMRAHFGLPSISSEDNNLNKAPINVKFEIPYFTVCHLCLLLPAIHSATIAHPPRLLVVSGVGHPSALPQDH
jgi:AP-1 complex subunit mu